MIKAMAEVIRMPRLSDTMEEGVIVAWLKKVGDNVEPGDILAEVETDKATMDLESFHSGVLLHIGVEQGAVPVDGVLAVIGEKGEDFESLLQDESTNGQNQAAQSDAKESGPAEVQESAKEAPQPAAEVIAPAAAPAVSSDDNGRLKASPLAKVMATEAGISLGSIKGSGDHGRIIKRDVEAAIASPAISTSPVPSTVSYGTVAVSQMRKTIARRLSESKFTAPHFYLTMDIDMSQAVSDRKAINVDADIRVSFNDMVVKACALALKAHPAVNSSWLGDHIRINEDVNIGVAVAVEDGLLVPVIRNADRKSLRHIHTEVVEYAGRAKEKRLALEEMQGNTFTISNLGMFGIEEFTAIINPPDACILAVGAITEKPVVRDGELTAAHMMKVTMSCDHRVVDGATGARFLQTVQTLLEQPVRMLG